jgi:hypothetical protein
MFALPVIVLKNEFNDKHSLVGPEYQCNIPDRTGDLEEDDSEFIGTPMWDPSQCGDAECMSCWERSTIESID